MLRTRFVYAIIASLAVIALGGLYQALRPEPAPVPVPIEAPATTPEAEAPAEAPADAAAPEAAAPTTP